MFSCLQSCMEGFKFLALVTVSNLFSVFSKRAEGPLPRDKVEASSISIGSNIFTKHVPISWQVCKCHNISCCGERLDGENCFFNSCTSETKEASDSNHLT